MSGAGVNSISVLGHELLLVDVGGGAETHLAATDGRPNARAALADVRVESSTTVSIAGYDGDALLARRWAPSTLCGRVWWEMAAGEGGAFQRWHEVALSPTCRSCLRAVDALFPSQTAPGGVELLASVVADTVVALGSAHITGVPAEHIEATRRAARRHLRERGFRSRTYVVNTVVHVISNDALQAVDPSVRKGWMAEAMARIHAGESSTDRAPVDTGHGIDWHTWVIDS